MAHFRNLAYGIVRTAPSPSTTGTTLIVETGHGARFPPVPFQATVWPVPFMPDPTTAEIVTVTLIAGNTFTIVRAQEGTTARAIQPEDQIAATITKAYLDLVPLLTDPTVHWTGNQIVDGDLTVDDITSGGALIVHGTLHVDGPTTLDDVTTGDITATGAVIVHGTAHVDGNVTVGGAIQDARLTSPILQGYYETIQPQNMSGGTLIINYPAGNHVIVDRTLTITGITVNNLPPSGYIAPIMIYWRASATVGLGVTHTINGVAVRFPSNLPPPLATLSGHVDRILYTTPDAGATWFGDIIGLDH